MMKDQLKDFLEYLSVERGLAKNTIVAYNRDLKSYIFYLRTKTLKISPIQIAQQLYRIY